MMTQRRPHYAGSVDVQRSGRWRARLRIQGERRTIGTFATEAEAKGALDAYIAALGQMGSHPAEGRTLNQVAASVFVLRRAEGYRSVADDENRWKNHGEPWALASLPVSELRAADVREWLSSLARSGLATQTRRNCLTMLRAILEHAVDGGELHENVADGIRVRHHGSTEETSTFLSEAEVERLLAVTLDEFPEVALAIATGMRAGEHAALRWENVHAEHVHVRYGSPGRPTKNGSTRRVPMLPLAAAALARAKKLAAGSPWVHPGRDGARFHVQPRGHWQALLEAAGIERHVRWHDLRHTCAVLLLQGARVLVPDGRPWSLEAVKDMLGHSSIESCSKKIRTMSQRSSG